MLYGYPYSEASGQPTWLDSLVISNPNGVMLVLDRNGYTGYLAPQGPEELLDAAYDFVEKKGDDAVIELLKVHPLYDVIADVATENKIVTAHFKSATGEDIPIVTMIKTIDYRKLLETMLVVIGVVWIANEFWKFFNK
jgi:hypothetical protein